MRRVIVLAASALALAASALAGCQQPASETATEKSASEASTVPPPSGVPTTAPTPAETAQAFQAVWDQAPPVRRASTEQDGAALTYSTGRLIGLGGDRYALVSEGQGEDGHVSAGGLAIHYVTRTAEGFRRLPVDQVIVEGGTFGSPPQWTERDGLFPAKALVAESGGTWQGYTCTTADLVELTPQRPVLRALRIKLHHDNGGAAASAAEEEEIDGRLEPGAPGQTFKVRYVGSHPALVVWRADAAGLYKAVDEPADLPWC